MATLYTIKRIVPKLYRNKRVYQGGATVSVNTAQGSGAAESGYTAGDGLILTGTEFSTTNTAQYFIMTDGVDTIRRGVRSGKLVEDVELTPTGFDGVENTDWETRESEPI